MPLFQQGINTLTNTVPFHQLPSADSSGNMYSTFHFAQPTPVLQLSQSVPAPAADPLMVMLQTMNDKLSSIQGDICTLMTSKTELTNKLDGLCYDQEDDHDTLLNHHKEICGCQDQVDLLTNIVIKQEDQIDEWKSKMLAYEAQHTRNELIIFGIKENTKDTCINQARQFFTSKLGITTEIPITQAYWKGKAEHKPMVVKLANASAKGLIFSNTSKLKGVKNENNRGYRILNHLPDELAEPQMRQRQIIVENRKLGEGQQQGISFKKGKLLG